MKINIKVLVEIRNSLINCLKIQNLQSGVQYSISGAVSVSKQEQDSLQFLFKPKTLSKELTALNQVKSYFEKEFGETIEVLVRGTNILINVSSLYAQKNKNFIDTKKDKKTLGGKKINNSKQASSIIKEYLRQQGYKIWNPKNSTGDFQIFPAPKTGGITISFKILSRERIQEIGTSLVTLLGCEYELKKSNVLFLVNSNWITEGKKDKKENTTPVDEGNDINDTSPDSVPDSNGIQPDLVDPLTPAADSLLNSLEAIYNAIVGSGTLCLRCDDPNTGQINFQILTKAAFVEAGVIALVKK